MARVNHHRGVMVPDQKGLGEAARLTSAGLWACSDSTLTGWIVEGGGLLMDLYVMSCDFNAK